MEEAKDDGLVDLCMRVCVFMCVHTYVLIFNHCLSSPVP